MFDHVVFSTTDINALRTIKKIGYDSRKTLLACTKIKMIEKKNVVPGTT